MARIRTIKPEFWTDEKIVELSFPARLLCVGLWNFADDDGRLVYSPKRLKMQIFPADDVDAAKLAQELVDQQLVQVYSVDGIQILAIPTFAHHQKIDRRTPSKLPPPPRVPPTSDHSSTSSSELPRVPLSSAEPTRVLDESPRVPPTEGKGMEWNVREKNLLPSPSAPACEERTGDHRFQKLVDVIHQHYKAVNKVDCPWSAKDGRQAKIVLASLDPKDWTVEKLDRAVQFKLWSVDRSATEAPHRWLADLPKYFEAPLDRFGRPDFEKRAAWERKFQKRTATLQADPGEVLPEWYTAPSARTFSPDPALAEFLDANPDPWQVIREAIRPSINPHSFDTWIRPLRIGGVDGRKLVVRLPTKDFAHIGERYGTAIQNAIEKLRFPFEGVEFYAEAS